MMLALGIDCALTGNEVVSCLYSFRRYDGYDVIFLNCEEEGSVRSKVSGGKGWWMGRG